jgi:uncharacterized protein YeaO (DUF488 family)
MAMAGESEHGGARARVLTDRLWPDGMRLDEIRQKSP